ncbi:MAG: carbon storage regulator [Vampirovibrio sp.]|jgi:carbon storage regulator|nr:carbon storage regulator [Vampirovibrio sp.]
MLVLTRKTGQKIIIANEIEVTILETKGDSVKLGIQAPKHIAIYREEIYEEIKKANLQATEQAQASALNEAVSLLKPSATKQDI